MDWIGPSDQKFPLAGQVYFMNQTGWIHECEPAHLQKPSQVSSLARTKVYGWWYGYQAYLNAYNLIATCTFSITLISYHSSSGRTASCAHNFMHGNFHGTMHKFVHLSWGNTTGSSSTTLDTSHTYLFGLY